MISLSAAETQTAGSPGTNGIPLKERGLPNRVYETNALTWLLLQNHRGLSGSPREQLTEAVLQEALSRCFFWGDELLSDGSAEPQNTVGAGEGEGKRG